MTLIHGVCNADPYRQICGFFSVNAPTTISSIISGDTFRSTYACDVVRDHRTTVKGIEGGLNLLAPDPFFSYGDIPVEHRHLRNVFNATCTSKVGNGSECFILRSPALMPLSLNDCMATRAVLVMAPLVTRISRHLRYLRPLSHHIPAHYLFVFLVTFLSQVLVFSMSSKLLCRKTMYASGLTTFPTYAGSSHQTCRILGAGRNMSTSS